MRLTLFLLLSIGVVSLLFVITYQKATIDKLEQDLSDTALLLTEQYQETQHLYGEIFTLLETEEALREVKDNPRKLMKIVCEEYNVDYVLAISIARAETGNFTSKLFLENNNIGGLKGSNGWLKYDTLAEGINDYVLILKKYYIDKGLDTPEKMQPKYCPGDDGQHWVQMVNSIMEEERYT